MSFNPHFGLLTHTDIPKLEVDAFYHIDIPQFAEREGFEPPVPCGTHDFESRAFNQALPPLPTNNKINN